MNLISIIFLVLKIMMRLPSILAVGVKIIALIKQFSGDLQEDLVLVAEILRLILSLIVDYGNKSIAKEGMIDLKTSMIERLEGKPQAVSDLHGSFKRRCEGVMCESDLVGS